MKEVEVDNVKEHISAFWYALFSYRIKIFCKCSGLKDLIGITVFCGEMRMKSYLTTQIKIAILATLVMTNLN